MANEISKITVGSVTYDIKDATARRLIAGGINFVVSTSATDTPEGVTWAKSATENVTGTLTAKKAKEVEGTTFYLVPSAIWGDTEKREYIAVGNTTSAVWEKIGDTHVDITGLVREVSLDKKTDVVLGEGTTFTNSTSNVTFGTHTSIDAITSVPGSESKLATTTITGTNGTVTIPNVTGNEGVTATNTTFGENTSATKITTADKTATNTVFGTDKTASKATELSDITITGTNGTGNVIGVSAAATDLVYNMHVTDETLSFSTVGTATQQTFAKVASSATTIKQHSFADVNVPTVSSNASVAFKAVSTATDVDVPVVTSNETVSASKVTLGTAISAAKVATSATTVATGKVASTDTNGDTILVGLGTIETKKALQTLGSATAAAQTITVGTNDKVTTLTSETDVDVTKVQ